MLNDRRRRTGGERGAVLVHAAIAMLALMAFNALVIDYGALWLSRSQAQNAADAAALAGALSLAFDDPDDIPRAQSAAAAAGTANLVLDAAPSIIPATDVTLIPCPPGAPGLPDTCIRANVYRSAARANALPTFFAQIMGITLAGYPRDRDRAGHDGQCRGVHEAVGRRGQVGRELGGRRAERRSLDDGLRLRQVPEAGQHVRARSGGDDAGCLHRAHRRQPRNRVRAVRRGWQSDFRLRPSDRAEDRRRGEPSLLGLVPRARSAQRGWLQRFGRRRTTATTSRTATAPTYKIGDTLTVSSEQGNMVGPTRQGVEGGGPGGMGLTEKDPGATWNTATKSIQGSCAPGVCADGLWYARSPRIVPVPLFDIDAFFAGSPNGKTTVNITNIMGFFIEGMCGAGNKDVCGRLVAIPGLTSGGGSVDETAVVPPQSAVGALSEKRT